MPEITFIEKRKDLPVDQLRYLFMSAGWCRNPETPEMIAHFNLPFINATLVISAWHEDRLVGVVRVLSDKIIRSFIYDLVVDPDFRSRGIGQELLERCVRTFPKTEWIVQTDDEIVPYYLKNGFTRYSGNLLYRPSAWDPEYQIT